MLSQYQPIKSPTILTSIILHQGVWDVIKTPLYQGKRILIDVFLVVIQSIRAKEARFLRCLEA
jgi:hypothetical protein